MNEYLNVIADCIKC